MSRLGKKGIAIPEKTEVTVASGVVSVKGPLGELSRSLPEHITVSVDAGHVSLKPESESLEALALWGTTASHIMNMMNGVNTAYVKKLNLEGIGYRMEVKGNSIVWILGFSHPVTVEIPAGIKVVIEKNTMSISGIDKDAVGQFAARMRALKKPEPYKGKGIRYEGEVIKMKQGKKSV